MNGCPGLQWQEKMVCSDHVVAKAFSALNKGDEMNKNDDKKYVDIDRVFFTLGIEQ